MCKLLLFQFLVDHWLLIPQQLSIEVLSYKMLEFIIPSCILYQVHKTSVVAKLIFINALICMCKDPCTHTIIGFTIHVSIFFAPMRLRIYRFDWFCLELMQKHWVLILHLKTKYINRCQFIW